ncbi:scarecrow-like protein 14 [Rhododendron vialii]|uniref:scarecrow-like protein 14 n=1 Tax=Rhododendron vialii TaxID=182163 RepID=UPI00265E3A8D|nr:scarecrow-like protein 14 [Rhododendron vialii]
MLIVMDEQAQVFSNQNQQDYVDVPSSLPSEGNTNHVSSCSSTCLRLEDALIGEEYFSDATLRLINQMLMEEDDLENKPCMFQECLALQATEKSFYDALGNEYTSPSNQSPLGFDFDDSPGSTKESFDSIDSFDNFVDVSNWLLDREERDRDFYSENTFEESILPPTVPSNGSGEGYSVESHFSPLKALESSNGSVGEEDENKREKSPNRSREKKTRDREDGGDFADGGRGNKQLASSAQESDDQFEMYDKVLLCPPMNPNSHRDSSLFLVRDHHAFPNGVNKKSQQNQNEQSKGSNGGGGGNAEKEGNEKEVVDLMTLLSQCAQAVSIADHKNAYNLLNQIKQHSSPYGDGVERLAHYFGNALEARLVGTGAALYAALATKRISTADILRGYEVHVRACPFNWLSNGYANRSIRTLVQDSQRLHIIDFGILYGFQWPCLIQNLSVRPGGPPRVQITGIDFPQPGFRPSERVEETGRRLATYCERFGVPFQFNAIAKKWDNINLDDLKIESDEVLVVNCLYRLRNVPDETVAENCPRDGVLNLVRRINPDMFIHGVLNGACNGPFFISRFREAIRVASSLFDMFEATVPREDEGRRMYEKEVWGRDIMNVIACEDTERIERPETYKQWQIRNVRAGFRQLPLNREILRELKGIVKVHYNKNFTVEEDGKWMLQGWKGRIMFALSCWKPIKES